MLAALNKRKIPFVLISGIFRPGQLFFRWYGNWFLFRLKMFTKFFVQDQQSVNLLASAGIIEVVQCGDTRIDRVSAICKESLSIEKAEVFSEGAKVLVAGSTWSPDEEILCRYLNNCPENLKAILAPHMVDPDHIDQIRKKLKVPVAVFSSANLAELANTRVLIIDNVGMLSSLYKYASFAYIGGGFGKSIHNILEPATFGIPVIFGPRHEKFREAKDMIQTGAAFSVQDYDGFEKLVTIFMSDESERKKAGNAAGAYIESNTGATEVVMKELKKILSSEYSA
jgi:3-deoxy-D-manno-octulosonic-acid transferase